MKVVFDKRLHTAVLMSPLLPNNSHQTDSCLQIQYRLIDTKVRLRINITDSSVTSSVILATITYNNQTNASNWNNASIALNHQFGQLKFVAQKIGYTAGPAYVAIRKVEIRENSCPTPGSIRNN